MFSKRPLNLFSMSNVGGNDTTDWQINCLDLKQRGSHLLHTGLWSDCVFRVGDEVIKAHKLMLAMASSVFAAMLYGGLYESTTGPIFIEDIAPEVFRALLEYIYTEKLGETTFDIAYGLYCAANKYMLPHLVKQCSKYIASNISVENVCQSYELASFFDDTFLMNKSLKFISSNTTQVLEDSSFVNIQLDTLLKVFSLENLSIDSELELVNAVERYTQSNAVTTPNVSTAEDEVSVPNSTSSNTTTRAALDMTDKFEMRHATEQIRFLTLTPKQFEEVLSKSSLLTVQERSAVLANILSSSCNVPMPHGFCVSRQPRSCINKNLAEAIYCIRNYILSTDTCHMDKPRCSIFFRVNQRVSLLGFQVPTQMMLTRVDDTYQEDIRVILNESQGTFVKIAEVSFSASVNYDDLIDIMFQAPVALKEGKDTLYHLEISFKCLGVYPCGEGSMTVSGADAARDIFRLRNIYDAEDLLRSFIIEKPDSEASR